jgi:hypothetical protein
MNLKSLKFWLKQSFTAGLMNGLVVTNFAGTPFVQLKEEKIKPKLKDNLSLKSDTFIRTNANEYVVLKVNDRYKVTVLPDSIFTLDGVRHKDEFNIRSVYIGRGKIYIEEIPDKKEIVVAKPTKAKSKSKIQPRIPIIDDLTSGDKTISLVTSADSTLTDHEYEALKIESDFFVFLTEKDQKLSLLVDVDLKTATLNVCNFSKDFKLELYDHEEAQTIKANEGIKFIGVADKSGRVAYDLLLEKRKIPKGKWAQKEVCDSGQIKALQDNVIKFHEKSLRDLEAGRFKKTAEKRVSDLKYPCHKPYGKLDQCHFILRQNKCIRERCNAEGKWTDQTEIGIIKNLCSPQGEVKACGY